MSMREKVRDRRRSSRTTGSGDDSTTRPTIGDQPPGHDQPAGLPGRVGRGRGPGPDRVRDRDRAAVLRRWLRHPHHGGHRVQLADAGRDQPVLPVRARAPGRAPRLRVAAGERGPGQDHRRRVHPGWRVRRGDDQQLRDADVVGQRVAGQPAALHQQHPGLRRAGFPAPAAGHPVAQGRPVLGPVLRRVIVPDVPQGPDDQVQHQHAEEADLETGRADRRDPPRQGPGRHLPARRPRLGREPGPDGHRDQRLRRPLVQPAVGRPSSRAPR